jgi:hypothetical protein
MKNIKAPTGFIPEENRKDFSSMIGNTYNRLHCEAVVGKVPEGKKFRPCYLFTCKCGTQLIARGKDVKSGHTKSCGCLSLEAKSLNGKANKGKGKNSKYTGKDGKKQYKQTDRSAFNRLVTQYRCSAKRKSLQFELTREEIERLTKSDCYYCGIPAQKEYAKGLPSIHLPYICNGIDRVDNSLGYLLGNCVPCCEICNYAKRAQYKQQFLEWAERVHKHNTPLK